MTRKVYYNEFDPHAAAWLRELMKAGLIPEGDVDERSITEVAAADLRGYSSVHLFAGIGGWPHALRLAGAGDHGWWTGSCPCQPFSSAGKRKGTADARHLWPDMLRLVAECRPPVCFGEQVASGDGRRWLAGVRADLEAVGYAVGAADLCAAGVGAPHIRQRLFWVADAAGVRGPHVEGVARPGWAVVGPLDRAGSRDGDGDSTAGVGGGRVDGGAGGLARRLADPDGGEPGDGGLQPGREHGQQPADGGTGARRVGDADRPRADVHPPGCPPRAAVGESGGTGRVGDALPAGQPTPEREALGRAGWREEGGAAAEPGGAPAPGFWDAFDLIPCRDGKARRVEPGTFPLAHGIPGRVGLLRGYGNSIVPQVAAAFIKAYLEARGQ